MFVCDGFNRYITIKSILQCMLDFETSSLVCEIDAACDVLFFCNNDFSYSYLYDCLSLALWDVVCVRVLCCLCLLAVTSSFVIVVLRLIRKRANLSKRLRLRKGLV